MAGRHYLSIRNGYLRGDHCCGGRSAYCCNHYRVVTGFKCCLLRSKLPTPSGSGCSTVVTERVDTNRGTPRGVVFPAELYFTRIDTRVVWSPMIPGGGPFVLCIFQPQNTNATHHIPGPDSSAAHRLHLPRHDLDFHIFRSFFKSDVVRMLLFPLGCVGRFLLFGFGISSCIWLLWRVKEWDIVRCTQPVPFPRRPQVKS